MKPFHIDAIRKFPGFVHGFSPRSFESGEGVKTELKLGRKGLQETSAQHMQWFLKSLNIASGEVFILNQVHGNQVYVLEDPDLSPEQVGDVEADALITHLVDRPIGVLTADCVPVILYDPKGHVTGVVHAGRKGTQQRILSATVASLSRVFGSQPADMIVGFGPAIGGCCYEVDAPCLPPFQKNFSDWERFTKQSADGKYRLDLPAANKLDALSAGVRLENIFDLEECTACHPERWFSYRKEGPTGRLISLTMLRDSGR